MEEAKHWEALKAGNINALQELYNHHIGALYSYGMVLCQDPDRVKDSIHDLFLSLWSNHQGISVPSSGKAYLVVSLRRRIFDKGTKNNLATSPFEDTYQEQDVFESSEEKWIMDEEETERQQKLDTALAQLSDRQREIIHMKYIQDMEYDEIAQVMGLNYQSARNLVNRGLIALRKTMISWIGLFIYLM